MAKTRHNLTIKKETYDEIHKMYKQEKSEKSFTQWTSDKIILVIKKENFLKKIIPHIEKIVIQNNSIILRDKQLQKLVEVTYKDGIFFCDTDKDKCCTHIKFVLTMNDVLE